MFKAKWKWKIQKVFLWQIDKIEYAYRQGQQDEKETWFQLLRLLVTLVFIIREHLKINRKSVEFWWMAVVMKSTVIWVVTWSTIYTFVFGYHYEIMYISTKELKAVCDNIYNFAFFGGSTHTFQ
jgi:hypothetical protein